MLHEWLQDSKHTVVFTGAGMSTESGLPDFRSTNRGIWRKKDPSKIASVDALNHHVEDFIEFYRERVLGVKEFGPHKGHQILAEWEKNGLIQAIITQNVDGFHQAAGSEHVYELHGTLRELHCQSCGKVYDSSAYINEDYYCSCGGILRPSIVLFGEMLPEDAFSAAFELSKQADLFIVLGSSLSVTPANQFPEIAKQNGAKLVIVNQEKTPLDNYADLVVFDRKIGAFLEETNKLL